MREKKNRNSGGEGIFHKPLWNGPEGMGGVKEKNSRGGYGNKLFWD